MVQPIWKTACMFLRKLEIELSYDPAIPLLGIYPDKTIASKDTCTPVFIAASLTIAKTEKHPKCSLTNEWIQVMWYLYKIAYHSVMKKNGMPFAATWMQLESIILSEINQKEKEKYHIVYMWDLKYDTGALVLETETDS